MEIAPLIQPLSDEFPCGPDLEYDNVWALKFQQMEAKLEGEKRQKAIDGRMTEEFVPPKWPEVKSLAYELCHESRTLRLGVVLTQCGIEIEGLNGLRDGLSMIRTWLADYWDQIHPGPVEDAKELRMPVLATLNANAFIGRIEKIPIATNNNEPYSLFDILQADAARDGTEAAVNRANIARFAVGKMSGARKGELRQVAEQAAADAQEIENIFTEKSGVRHTFTLGNLTASLLKLVELLAPEIVEAVDDSGESGNLAMDGGGSGGGGPIRSRAAVKKSLEEVIRFYQGTEPSSPVPALIRRAIRCMDMTFMELLDELAPSKDEAVRILGAPDSPGGSSY